MVEDGVRMISLKRSLEKFESIEQLHAATLASLLAVLASVEKHAVASQEEILSRHRAALRALRPFRDRLTLIASGGLRSGIDMVKGLVLGAELCGLAAPFLEPAMESAARVVEVIRRLKREFVTAMFLLGVATTRDLVGNERLLAQEAPPLTRDEPA